MHAITSSTVLWYASRATGVVALGLLTAVMILGLTVAGRGGLPGLPRFGVTALHRNLSLLAVAFVVTHVVTAIADPYVTIGIAATVIPFVSPYETVWIGIGAVAIDLMIALIVTSLVRVRLGQRTWRAIHWLAYATWPVAFAHSIGAARDMRGGPLLGFAVICALAVVAAVIWRLVRSRARAPIAQRAAGVLWAAEAESRRAADHEFAGSRGGAL